jgi:hypothetical protein
LNRCQFSPSFPAQKYCCWRRQASESSFVTTSIRPRLALDRDRLCPCVVRSTGSPNTTSLASTFSLWSSNYMRSREILLKPNFAWLKVRRSEQVLNRLNVICVEYGSDKPCTMRQSYQTDVPTDCHGVFVHGEVVGVFYFLESSTQLFMLAINMETGVSVTTPLDILSSSVRCHELLHLQHMSSDVSTRS